MGVLRDKRKWTTKAAYSKLVLINMLFYDFYNVANAESLCKCSILKSLVTGTIYFLLHAAGTLKFQYIFFV